MADKNVTQRAETHEAIRAVDDAFQLSILMEWIESARQVIGAIEVAADNSPELKNSLKQYSISMGGAAWDLEQSDALIRLHSIQGQYISTASEAARGAAL